MNAIGVIRAVGAISDAGCAMFDAGRNAFQISRIWRTIGQMRWCLMLAILLLAVAGCRKDNSKLVGTWAVTKPYTGVVAFAGDGTFERIGPTAETTIIKGTYSLKGDRLTMHAGSEKDDEDYKVVWQDANVFTMTYIPRSDEKGISAEMAAMFAATLQKSGPGEHLTGTELTRGVASTGGAGGTTGGAPGGSPEGDCFAHAKQIALATLMYSADYDDVWPTAAWQEAVTPYLRDKNTFDCPAVVAKGGSGGYAYNSRVVGARSSDLALPTTPVFFDSDAAGPSAISDFSLVPKPPRHPSGNVVAYGDGHTAFVK